MDREKLLRIKAKCKQFFTYMKFMALLVLTFLYLQNLFFLSDISSVNLLVPKISAVAGIFQIILFTIFIFIEEGSLTALKDNLEKYIFNDIRTTFQMALPPAFLLLSNELLLISSSILPNLAASASNYTILGVLVFTVLIMKRKIYLTQYLAVYFISRGLDEFPSDSNTMFDQVRPAYDSFNMFYGYLAIVWAILCYGLSYVVLEKVLKSSEVSLWIRGIQLNLFTVPLSLMLSFTNDYMNGDQRGFFESFNIIAWFFIIFKVAQQMMELFVIKVADSVYRSISLATALVIISILKEPFPMFESSPVKLGAGLVLAGVCLYATMDFYPKWGEVNEYETDEQEYREPPIDCNETLIHKGYKTVPTVSSAVSNADVYMKIIDEPATES